MGSTLEFAGQQNGGPPNGMFQYVGTLGNGRIGTREVRDGLSNTIAFGEWRVGTGVDQHRSRYPRTSSTSGVFPAGPHGTTGR